MSELQSVFGDSKIYYLLTMSGMIMFFTYFYSNIIFNPKNTADHLQTSGSFIKGIRPGKTTEKFLADTLKRLCFIGGSFIVIITILPEILVSYFSIPFYLGGTSLLIMVLITKEWYEQYELSNHKNKYETVKNNLMSNFK
jgi:preprotein translocase subunit SecY